MNLAVVEVVPSGFTCERVQREFVAFTCAEKMAVDLFDVSIMPPQLEDGPAAEDMSDMVDVFCENDGPALRVALSIRSADSGGSEVPLWLGDAENPRVDLLGHE